MLSRPGRKDLAVKMPDENSGDLESLDGLAFDFLRGFGHGTLFLIYKMIVIMLSFFQMGVLKMNSLIFMRS